MQPEAIHCGACGHKLGVMYGPVWVSTHRGNRQGVLGRPIVLKCSECRGLWLSDEIPVDDSSRFALKSAMEVVIGSHSVARPNGRAHLHGLAAV